jgi:hypothetical protein
MNKLADYIQCLLFGHVAPDLTKYQIWELNNGLNVPQQFCRRCGKVRTPVLGDGGWKMGGWK